MKKRGKQIKYKLGDLIVALFDEAKKVSSDRLEQDLIVYAALKDLMQRRNRTLRPVPVRV